jgi:excisionase family DNA binding protein
MIEVTLTLTDDQLDAIAGRIAGKLPLAEQPQDEWLDSRRAAQYLGLSLGALHRLTAARRIPFVQDGPNCRCWFKRDRLDAWRAQGATGPQTSH